MNRGERYSLLMRRAAGGDRDAARALIREGFFPGDWSLASEQDKVMEYAVEVGYGRPE